MPERYANKFILKNLLAQIYLAEIAVAIVSSILVIFSIHFFVVVAVLCSSQEVLFMI